ncbi:hypothetical protein IH992_16915 [Candidatus Poribacteria bacterium]|nr:hypothetical protein [Candidatus Poribacteria bacterium]
MFFKSLSYWIWFTILAGIALVLANIPLFNLLAFEFCAILAISISFAGAHIAVTCVQNFRRKPQSLKSVVLQIPLILFWQSFSANLTLLAVPLIIILLNGLRVKNCDFSEGFAFFLLLPVISCVYASAAGVFFGLWMGRRWTAYLAYVAYIFATLSLLAYNLIFHPPVFGYHSIFGYFPGPIYDERISITGTLLIARGTTLLIAAIFLWVSINTVEAGRHTQLMPKLRWKRLYQFKLRFEDRSRRILLIALVAIFGLIYLYRGELGLRPTRGYIEKKLGGLKETAHFKIFYEKGSKVERKIESIAQDHEFRYAQLIHYFEMQPTRKVQAYIYTSPEQKKRLMGARGTSVEDPFGHGYHINYRSFPHPIMKHELAHALTADWSPFLKVSLKLGLHEGIAVAADWDEGQLTAHQWSKAMRQLNIAPSIHRIMGLGFWTQASSKSYTLAGSFVRFVVDTYGIEKFKRVFQRGNFRKVYGKPLSDLVQEWEAFLETISLTTADVAIAEHRFKRPSIFQKSCAHEIAELSAKAWGAYRRSDFDTAFDLFWQIHTFDPDNPRYLRGLMYTNYKMGRYAGAYNSAFQIIAHPKASVRQIAEAKSVRGDVYWADAHWQGKKHKDARMLYQRVFDLHASEALDRAAQAKLAALMLNSTNIKDKIKRVLIGQVSSQLKMTLLHEVIDELPSWGLAYYLVGRQHHFDQDYAASNRYLSKAAKFGLPHPILQIENTRLIGVNAYHLRRYDQSIQQFQKIATGSMIHNAKDWIERCKWAKRKKGN